MIFNFDTFADVEYLAAGEPNRHRSTAAPKPKNRAGSLRLQMSGVVTAACLSLIAVTGYGQVRSTEPSAEQTTTSVASRPKILVKARHAPVKLEIVQMFTDDDDESTIPDGTHSLIES
jgi:hypothetical protein